MEPLTDNETIKRVTLIAEMYYLHHMSQKDIAERLGISRPWVSKLLKRAEELNIVRIEVKSAFTGCEDLQEKLSKKFNMKNIYVVESMNNESFASVGHAAANYLVSKVLPGDTIGVSWGMSLTRMVDFITPMMIKDVSVIPLVGGAGTNAECLSNMIANRIAQKLGASYELLHANACCSDEREHEIVMQNPITRGVIERGERANIAIVGLGDLKHSRLIEYGYITPEDEAELERIGAIGDIALRLVDKGGEVMDIDFNKRIVAGDLETVRQNAREVIAIAFGEHKAKIIKAALKSGLITTLFTDSQTAEKLL